MSESNQAIGGHTGETGCPGLAHVDPRGNSWTCYQLTSHPAELLPALSKTGTLEHLRLLMRGAIVEDDEKRHGNYATGRTLQYQGPPVA